MDDGTDHIEQYLLSLHATSWGGKGWDVTDTKERREAVLWIRDLLDDLLPPLPTVWSRVVPTDPCSIPKKA